MDARLLGLWTGRLLLGAGHLGEAATDRSAMDAWLLGFAGGIYGWHADFWGPHVGFYGGVNYGFGYSGFGFGGGMWSGGGFRYNTAFTNVNTTVVRNVYVNRTVISNTTMVNNRASFNGPGGIAARPTFQEQTAMREQHFQPTPKQVSQQQIASQDRTQLASINHGVPQSPQWIL